MTLNAQLAAAARNHQVTCEEGPNRIWSVVCWECIEKDPAHPNYGNRWCRAAPGGEEQATRIALDHLARLGYVPKRLPKVSYVDDKMMGVVVEPRNTLE